MIGTANQITLARNNEAHGRYAGEVHTGFWWGNLKEKDNLEDLAVYWEIILKWILKNTMGKCGLN